MCGFPFPGSPPFPAALLKLPTLRICGDAGVLVGILVGTHRTWGAQHQRSACDTSSSSEWGSNWDMDPLQAQAQVMGWLLPSFPPSTRVLVSASALKAVVGGGGSILLPAAILMVPVMPSITRWMVAVVPFPG